MKGPGDNDIDYRLRNIFSEILSVEADEIVDSSSPRSIKNWKGLNHRRIIEGIEAEFDIEFDESERETLVSYKIIKATVLAYID